MAATTGIKVKLGTRFADDNTASVEFTNVESTTGLVETIRANVKAFDVNAVSDTYVCADTGSPLAEIKSATITITEDEEINLNV